MVVLWTAPSIASPHHPQLVYYIYIMLQQIIFWGFRMLGGIPLYCFLPYSLPTSPTLPLSFSYFTHRGAEMEDIHLFFSILLLWTIHHSHAHQDGASQTSCYGQTIIHDLLGMSYPSAACATSAQCSALKLAVLCLENSDPFCCKDFGKGTLYTHCYYTCEFRLCNY